VPEPPGNSTSIAEIMNRFHGHTTWFQSWPQGPTDDRMNVCIAMRNATSTARARGISSANPATASNGPASQPAAAIPGPPAGRPPVNGAISQGNVSWTKPPLNFCQPLQK